MCCCSLAPPLQPPDSSSFARRTSCTATSSPRTCCCRPRTSRRPSSRSVSCGWQSTGERDHLLTCFLLPPTCSGLWVCARAAVQLDGGERRGLAALHGAGAVGVQELRREGGPVVGRHHSLRDAGERPPVPRRRQLPRDEPPGAAPQHPALLRALRSPPPAVEHLGVAGVRGVARGAASRRPAPENIVRGLLPRELLAATAADRLGSGELDVGEQAGAGGREAAGVWCVV